MQKPCTTDGTPLFLSSGTRAAHEAAFLACLQQRLARCVTALQEGVATHLPNDRREVISAMP